MTSNTISVGNYLSVAKPIAAAEIAAIRAEFPILGTQVNGKPLVYLDNAATSQKPLALIEAISTYYRTGNANIHRGVHMLSSRATTAYEDTRSKVAAFIGAAQSSEVIFTHGTTESINLVASSFCRRFLKAGDNVLISALEHHSNIVPWQLACEAAGATLKVIPMNDRGELIREDFTSLLDERVKLIALSHISNSLGTINPVKEMIAEAHAEGIPVLLDGAQSAAHLPINVRDLDCDFFAFSGHKVFGPTGIGFLYGKEKWLEQMPPYMGGGEMIKTVTFEKTTYNDLPFKFEAGTPNIEGGICFAAALDYISAIGMDRICGYEDELLRDATAQLSEIPGLEIVGTAANKASIISFNIRGCHPYDIGVILDQLGIAVRTGHHCTEPIMDFYKIPGTVRASFAFYNTPEEITKLVAGVRKAVKLLT